VIARDLTAQQGLLLLRSLALQSKLALLLYECAYALLLLLGPRRLKPLPCFGEADAQRLLLLCLCLEASARFLERCAEQHRLHLHALQLLLCGRGWLRLLQGVSGGGALRSALQLGCCALDVCAHGCMHVGVGRGGSSGSSSSSRSEEAREERRRHEERRRREARGERRVEQCAELGVCGECACERAGGCAHCVSVCVCVRCGCVRRRAR